MPAVVQTLADQVAKKLYTRRFYQHAVSTVNITSRLVFLTTQPLGLSPRILSTPEFVLIWCEMIRELGRHFLSLKK